MNKEEVERILKCPNLNHGLGTSCSRDGQTLAATMSENHLKIELPIAQI